MGMIKYQLQPRNQLGQEGACNFYINYFCSNPVAGSASGRIQAKMASVTASTFIFLSHRSLIPIIWAPVSPFELFPGATHRQILLD